MRKPGKSLRGVISTRRGIAAALVAFLIFGTLPASSALAHDFTLPGGTSPGPPANPSGGQGASRNPNHEEPRVQAGTDPVDISKGDFIFTRQDLFLPGRGLSVDLTFTYRSRSAYNGHFGYGWDLSYNRRVRKLSNNNLVVLRGDNRKDEFVFSAPNTYAAPLGVYDALVQNADGTCTLTSKHGEKEFYDLNGNLVRMEDRSGNALTFTYDPAGLLPIMGQSDYFVNQTVGVIAREYRLIRITDTIGRVVDFTYNADGRVETFTSEGRIFQYDYDPGGSGDLISVTTPATPEFPSGSTTAYASSGHNLTQITDAKGQVYLTNVYDAATDRVTGQTYGAGASTLTYGTGSGGSATTELRDRRGFRTLYTFDAAGHITRMEQFTDGDPAGEPASYVTAYEYNAAGERTRVVYPRGNAAEFTYDAKGNLLEVRRKKIGIPKGSNDPTDLVTVFTYEPTFNFVKTSKDPRGNTTTYTYDYELGEPARGNLRRVTLPTVDGVTPQSVFIYNAFGQVETATDPNGNVTRYAYDSASGYITQVTRGFGTADASTTGFAHDSAGNVTGITDPNGRATGFTYNARSQLVRATAPAPFNFETHYRYDANGNLAQVDRQAVPLNPGTRPALGTVSAADDWQSTVYTYTSLDQLATVTDDLNQTTSFTYDNSGNRSSLRDAKNQVTTYLYDERDLLWKVTDAAVPAGTTETRYDVNGSLASLRDAKGNATTYTYDDFDRLTRTTYADGSFETYDYDAASNLKELRTALSERIEFTYDPLNRLTRKVTPLETVTSAYDAGSRLTQISDPDAALTYSYDPLDRVKQVVTAGPGLAPTTIGYLYDPAGNRTRLTYPDAGFVTYQYDALNRLDVIRDAGGASLADFNYDALSRRTGLVPANGTATGYVYDAANRLLAWSATHPTLGTLAQAAYTYDPIGNRETMTDPAGTHGYTYDRLSQVTAVDYPAGFAFADTSFTLDPLGNRTQVVAGGSATSYTPNALNQYTQVAPPAPAPVAMPSYDAKGNLTGDGTRTYAYDAENRLTSVIASSPQASEAIYTYDPLGRRITKTVNGVTTRFLYDGDQVLAETDAAGNIVARYLYGPGIDEPLRMERGGTVSWYHADGLGSTVALTDSTGAVTERCAYDIFGQPRITDAAGNPLAQSAFGNRCLFTGREWDAETGLYHCRARAYSPSLGRFLQRDPVGYSAGPNLYTYVDNNPLNFTDPLGLDKQNLVSRAIGLAGDYLLNADAIQDAIRLYQAGEGLEKIIALLGGIALIADAGSNIATLGGKAALKKAGTHLITLKPGQQLFRAFGHLEGQSRSVGHFLTTPGAIRRIGQKSGISPTTLSESLGLDLATDNPGTRLTIATVKKEVQAVIRRAAGGTETEIFIPSGSLEEVIDFGKKVFRLE